MSDVTDYLSIPLDSSRTGGLSSVYCTRNYDIDRGQKLVSLELYDYLTLFQYPWEVQSEYQGLSPLWPTCPLQSLHAQQPGPLCHSVKVSTNKLVPLVEDILVDKLTMGIQYDTGCQLSIIS